MRQTPNPTSLARLGFSDSSGTGHTGRQAPNARLQGAPSGTPTRIGWPVLALCWLLLSGLLSEGAAAPISTGPSSAPDSNVGPPRSPCVALVGGMALLPGGIFQANTTVVLEGGRIKAVGTGLGAPTGCTSVSAAGHVVTPGLIDAVTALGLEEVGLESPSVDSDTKLPPFRPGVRVDDAFHPRSVVIPITRTGGITSAVVLPQSGILCGQGAWADLRTGTTADMLVRRSLGQLLRIDEAAFDELLGSRSALWLRLRETFAEARAYQRDPRGYFPPAHHPDALSPLQLEALLPVLKGETPLVVRVSRASDVEQVLAFARQEKLKPILIDTSEAWILREAIAAAGVPVFLNPVQNLPDRFEELLVRSDQASVLEQAGVTVGLSTLSTANARQLRQVAGNAVRLGMSEAGALRAITEVPADAFGMSGYGRLQVGAVANVVLWSGSPLELDTRPLRMWIHGEEQSLESRQKALLERYRKVPADRFTLPGRSE